MRRKFSTWLITPATTLGTLALIAMVLSFTLFSPQQAGSVAGVLAANGTGRQMVADALANQIRQEVPNITAERVSRIRGAVLADNTFLGKVGGPASAPTISLDGAVDVIRSVDSEAADAVTGRLPASVDVLPAQITKSAAQAKSISALVAKLAGLAAALLAAAAVVIGPRRERILSQLGKWAVGVSLAQAALWVAVAALLNYVGGTWGAMLLAGLEGAWQSIAVVLGALAIAGGAVLIVLAAGKFMHPERRRRKPSAEPTDDLLDD